MKKNVLLIHHGKIFIATILLIVGFLSSLQVYSQTDRKKVEPIKSVKEKFSVDKFPNLRRGGIRFGNHELEINFNEINDKTQRIVGSVKNLKDGIVKLEIKDNSLSGTIFSPAERKAF